MDRRTFLGLATGTLFAAPLAAAAQQAGRVWRVGILATANPRVYDASIDELRRLGYLDGRNLAVELRSAEGRVERFPLLPAELVRAGVDVIIAGGPEASVRAARQATTRIPVVIVAIAEAAGRSLGIRVQSLEIRNPDALPGAFAMAAKERADAVFVVITPVFFRERVQLSKLAVESRLPAVYALREFAETGGLMRYGTNLPEMFRRAAVYVDKIFRGAKPGDLPMEQPTKFELVINLKTAKALGLTIPPALLQRADQVIE